MNKKMNKKINKYTCLISILILATLLTTQVNAQVDSSFTYQGELQDNNSPANDTYDFLFNLTDSDGFPFGDPSEHLNTDVVQGLFALNVDFNIDGYDGFGDVSFSIEVRKSSVGGTYTSLGSQTIQSVPLATNLTNGDAMTGEVLTFNGFQWTPQTPAGSSSPWVISGANINFTTGNVGVGTASPSQDFVVNGTTNGDVMRVNVNGSSKFLVDDNGGVGIGALNTPPVDGLKVKGQTELEDDVLVTGNMGINTGSVSNATLQAAVHIEATSSEGKALFVSSNFGQFGPDITLGGQGSAGSQDEGVISTDQRYPGSDMWLMSNDAVIIRLDQDNNEAGEFEIRQSTNTTVFKVDENGVVSQNGSTIHASDKRLKKDIVEIPYGLAEIMVLKPKAYNWKSHDQAYKSFGLIAQDVQKVIKEVVNVGEDEDKTLGLSYTELIPVLIKAMQEQQAIIDEQDRKINQLIKLSENFIK